MANIVKSLLFLSCLFSILSFTAAQCTTYQFPNQRTFAACNDLPVLNSTLYWNYYPISNQIDFAFRQLGISDQSRWVAWAINPTSGGMVGSQAFVALQKSDGSLVAFTSPITSYGTQLLEGKLSFPIYNMSATNFDGSITIFATLKLPNNMTTVNHVWQGGPVVHNVPSIHPTSGGNSQSHGTINFLSGKIEVSRVDKRRTMKNAHGLLCAISWGFLMPIGVIIARYVKVFEIADPAWFYLHVTVQSLGYVIGIIGWATGMYLGAQSVGVQHKGHRCMGITLVCLVTIQVLVGAFLRPKKDQKYRICWKLFHFCVGYGTIILIMIQVFGGIKILQPGSQWKNAYLGILICLGCVAVLLEFVTYLVLKGKAKSSEKSLDAVSKSDGQITIAQGVA